MVFRKFAAKRQIEKIRSSNPYLLECESSNNFGRLIGKPTHPAWPHFNQEPIAHAKFYFMPNKTINVIDVDFQNHYQDLTPEKWWTAKVDEESFAIHFECWGLPYEFVFFELYEDEGGPNLSWLKLNYPDMQINKALQTKRKSK